MGGTTAMLNPESQTANTPADRSGNIITPINQLIMIQLRCALSRQAT
ncbi:MAG: hypothetical protein ACQETO_04155 [Pseudomonadota bacterium]